MADSDLNRNVPSEGGTRLLLFEKCRGFSSKTPLFLHPWLHPAESGTPLLARRADSCERRVLWPKGGLSLNTADLFGPRWLQSYFPSILHHCAFLLCSLHPGKPKLQRGVPTWWFPTSSPSRAFVSVQILCPRAGGKGSSLCSMGCALGGRHWGNVPALCAAWAEGRMLPWARNHPRGHKREDFAGDLPAGCYRDAHGTWFHALHLLVIWVKTG